MKISPDLLKAMILREGNIKKLSKKLNVSPTTISKYAKQDYQYKESELSDESEKKIERYYKRQGNKGAREMRKFERVLDSMSSEQKLNLMERDKEKLRPKPKKRGRRKQSQLSILREKLTKEQFQKLIDFIYYPR